MSRRHDDSDAGFTVLEALVSFVLFAVIGTASISALVNGMRASGGSQDRVTAANLAQQDLQQIRALRAPAYPQAAAAHSVQVGRLTFTMTRTLSTTVCPVSTDPNNPVVAWHPGDPTSMTVTTSVTWPHAPAPVVMSAEIAC